MKWLRVVAQGRRRRRRTVIRMGLDKKDEFFCR